MLNVYTLYHTVFAVDCSKADKLKCEERRRRIRLGESLEALRPTMSVRAKQPPAHATPTLYDIVRFMGHLSMLYVLF